MDAKKVHKYIGALFELDELEILQIFADFIAKTYSYLSSTSWSLGKRSNGSYSVIALG